MSSIQRAFRLTPVGMAIAGAAPGAVMFVMIMTQTVLRLVDPCLFWNSTGTIVPSELQLPPRGQCHNGLSFTPDGRFSFAVLSMGMAGILLLLAVLGVAGAARSRPATVFAVSALFFVLTIPLMIGNFGIVTLISSICFCISGFLTKRQGSPLDRRPT